MDQRRTGDHHWYIRQRAGAAAGPTAGSSRAAFLRLIDRPRVPLSPEVEALPDAGPVVRERFAFSAQEGERVPGVLVKPRGASGRRPVVILLHGTGGSKSDAQIVKLSEALVARGFIAVAIDGRYHGERAKPGARSTEYVAAMLRAYRTPGAHPFLYDTVWDVMRLIDYLETRQDVERRRIGVMGISKGGMETYLAAAADPRIAVAVPVIGVQSFRWALDHDSWQSRVGTFRAAVDAAAAEAGVTAVDAAFVRRFYDRVVPGIAAEFDAPAMLPLDRPAAAARDQRRLRRPDAARRRSGICGRRRARVSGGRRPGPIRPAHPAKDRPCLWRAGAAGRSRLVRAVVEAIGRRWPGPAATSCMPG